MSRVCPLCLASFTHDVRTSLRSPAVHSERSQCYGLACEEFALSLDPSCCMQVSKDFDGVLSSRSTKELDSILASDVTLHKGAYLTMHWVDG